MSSVNTNFKLDPDFGTEVPPVEYSFWVTVFPENKDLKPYRFILFMPIISVEDNMEEYLHFAVNQLLEDNDDVRIKSCEDEDTNNIPKTALVASFDPEDPQTFIWLNPPKFMRH